MKRFIVCLSLLVLSVCVVQATGNAVMDVQKADGLVVVANNIAVANNSMSSTVVLNFAGNAEMACMGINNNVLCGTNGASVTSEKTNYMVTTITQAELQEQRQNLAIVNTGQNSVGNITNSLNVYTGAKVLMQTPHSDWTATDVV